MGLFDRKKFAIGDMSQQDTTDEDADTSAMDDTSDIQDNAKYAELVNSFTGSKGPQISTNSFASRNRSEGRRTQGPRNVYGQNEDGQIPAQAFATYFPSELNNIQKGAYSGSMIGSNPVYAPSQLMPYGLIDARKNALAQAADQKVAEDEAFASKMQQEPVTKRTNVQDQLHEAFTNYNKEWIDKGQKMYGGNFYKKLYNNPEYQAGLQNFKNFAAHEDAAVNTLAKFDTESQKDGYKQTPEQKEIAQTYLSGETPMSLLSSDPKVRAQAVKDMQKVYSLKAMPDEQKVVDDIIKTVQPDDIKHFVGITSKQPLYDVLKTSEDKSTPEGRLRNVTDKIWDQKYAGLEDQGAISKDDFFKLALDMTGKTHKEDIHTVSTKPNAGEGEGDDVIETASIGKPQGYKMISPSTGGQKEATVDVAQSATLHKPISVDLEMTTSVRDINGNTLPNQKGVFKVVGSDMKVVPVYKNGTKAEGGKVDIGGNVIPSERIDDATKKGAVEYKTMFYGTTKVPDVYGETVYKKDSDGKDTKDVLHNKGDQKMSMPDANQNKHPLFKEISITKPASELKGALGKSQKTLDKMNEFADQKNQELSGAQKPNFSVSQYNKAKGKNYTKAQLQQSFGNDYNIID